MVPHWNINKPGGPSQCQRVAFFGDVADAQDFDHRHNKGQ